MVDLKWNLGIYFRTQPQRLALGIPAPENGNAELDPNAIKRVNEAMNNVVTDRSCGEIEDDNDWPPS